MALPTTRTRMVTTSAFTAAESWHPKVRKDRTSLSKLRSAERAFEATVLRHLATYLKLALQHFSSYGIPLAPDSDEVDRASTQFLDEIDRQFDKQAFINEIRQEYAKPLELGAAFGAKDLPKGLLFAEDILLNIDWSLLDPEVVDWLDNQSATLVSNILGTTQQRLRAQLSTGIQSGLSRDAIAENIQAVLDDIPQWRARMIAQTEIINAHSQGALQVWEKSGVIGKKRWIDGQSNACPICSGLNNKITDLHGEFPGGHDAPPAHPGCRCTVAPVVGLE